MFAVRDKNRRSGPCSRSLSTRQVFKFGAYRDPVDCPTTVYLDNFRRGASYAQVDPAMVRAWVA